MLPIQGYQSTVLCILSALSAFFIIFSLAFMSFSDPTWKWADWIKNRSLPKIYGVSKCELVFNIFLILLFILQAILIAIPAGQKWLTIPSVYLVLLVILLLYAVMHFSNNSCFSSMCYYHYYERYIYLFESMIFVYVMQLVWFWFFGRWVHPKDQTILVLTIMATLLIAISIVISFCCMIIKFRYFLTLKNNPSPFDV